MKYSCVLLAGGNGKRMQNTTPKQYLLLAGKPIIMHNLERVDAVDDIDEVIIVCERGYIPYIKDLLVSYNLKNRYVFAEAGESRQQSVYNGLKEVSNASVLIHEAARPFVTKEDFQRIIEEEEPNVSYSYPIPFTVLKGKDYVEEILNRTELVNIQLPQKFDTALIREAHRKAAEENLHFTEDAGLLKQMCPDARIRLIKGSANNIKITEPIDLLVGEIIYREYVAGRK